MLLALLPDFDNFSLINHHFQAVPDSVRKDAAGVAKNHGFRRRLRLPGRKSIFSDAMEFDYDVIIIGGAFSGAATALMLKRKHPAARVLIIEKKSEFDRKVGESTTEISSCYMTKILGLANYLGHEQLAKQGLRLWFCKSPDQPFDDCVEVGPRYSARLQTFQVDRAKLDSIYSGWPSPPDAIFGARRKLRGSI